jgi:hypothetical protein
MITQRRARLSENTQVCVKLGTARKMLPGPEQQVKSVNGIKDDVSNTADREIVTTHVMDAPRELV